MALMTSSSRAWILFLDTLWRRSADSLFQGFFFTLIFPSPQRTKEVNQNVSTRILKPAPHNVHTALEVFFHCALVLFTQESVVFNS